MNTRVDDLDHALHPSALDGDAGPALPSSPERSAAILTGAMAMLASELDRGGSTSDRNVEERKADSERPVAPVLRLRRSRLWVAGVVIAGSAAAAVGHHQLSSQPAASVPDPAPVQAEQPPTPPIAKSPLPARSAVTSAPTASSAPNAEPPDVPSAEAPIIVDPNGRQTTRGQASTATSARATTASPKQAEDLLAKANTARRSGRYAEALELYQTVMKRFPASRQAEVARLAAASLRLDHLGDVAGAEALYDQGADGSMSAEALYGLAEAKRRRGDHGGERAALQRLLAEHPNSPLSRSARKRLETLSR